MNKAEKGEKNCKKELHIPWEAQYQVTKQQQRNSKKAGGISVMQLQNLWRKKRQCQKLLISFFIHMYEDNI